MKQLLILVLLLLATTVSAQLESRTDPSIEELNEFFETFVVIQEDDIFIVYKCHIITCEWYSKADNVLSITSTTYPIDELLVAVSAMEKFENNCSFTEKDTKKDCVTTITSNTYVVMNTLAQYLGQF